MEQTLIAIWRKLKAAMQHIEEELGYVPDDGTVHADTGSDGPPPTGTPPSSHGG